MGRTGNPQVTRLLVGFLRHYLDMTQEEFAAACGMYQPEVSHYEAGDTVPTARTMRRMGAAAGLDWPVVVHLLRIFEAFVATVDSGARAGSYESQDLDRTLLELARLAIAPYLMHLRSRSAPEPTRDRTLREAEEIWAGLESYAPRRRRKLIEQAPRASRNWALAVLACEASVRQAAGSAEEARELAELALSIAERVPGKEEWRRRLQGYCLLHLANAHAAANRSAQASQTFSRARELWRAGADLEPPVLEEARLVAGGAMELNGWFPWRRSRASPARSRSKQERLPSRLIPHRHRPRAELQPADELQVERLR